MQITIIIDYPGKCIQEDRRYTASQDWHITKLRVRSMTEHQWSTFSIVTWHAKHATTILVFIAKESGRNSIMVSGSCDQCHLGRHIIIQRHKYLQLAVAILECNTWFYSDWYFVWFCWFNSVYCLWTMIQQHIFSGSTYHHVDFDDSDLTPWPKSYIT